MKKLKLVSNRTKQNEIDELINSMRRIGLWYLMDLDYSGTEYSQEDIERETKKVAVELRTLSGRLLSIAFNEPAFIQGVNHERKRVEKR